MRNVLIIGYSNIWGGIEKFICDILDGVDRTKVRIDLLVYKVLSEEQKTDLRKKGVDIYYVPQIGKAPIAFLINIFLFYRTHRYDVIHIHSSHAISIMYTMPVWFHRTQIVFHSHNMAGNTQFLHRICRKIVEKRSNKKLACSRNAACYMFETLDEVEIVHNEIDVERYVYRNEDRIKKRNELGISRETFVVGNVCRFVPEKNLFFLIDIFVEIKRKHSDSQLLLVGDGCLKEDLLCYVRERGLEKYVIMSGMVSEPQDWYQVMDVFVMPSIYEGFPYVGIEAQANDLPVFFSDHITEEIKITDKVFFLSLSQNAEYWATAISCWMEQNTGGRRDNRKVIREAGYDLGATVRRIQDIYLQDFSM